MIHTHYAGLLHTIYTSVLSELKSDAASAFESFLAEVRADGTPSAVMTVRSDNGGECFGGDFVKLCRKSGTGIKQEFTPANSPQVQQCRRTSISTDQ